MGRVLRWVSFLVLMPATGLAAAQLAPPDPSSAPVVQSPQAAPQACTWEQVKDRLQLNNPTLLAGKLNISELQAQEITAHLRPNPGLSLLSDQIAPFNTGQPHGAFA